MSNLVKGCDPKAAAEYVKTVLTGKKIEVNEERYGSTEAERRDINITSSNEALSALLAKWVEERKKESDSTVIKLIDASTDQSKANPDKLPMDFGGIYMGDYKKNVIDIFKAKNLKQKNEELKDGVVTVAFAGHPQLKGVKETELSFWNGKLTTMKVFFSDGVKYADIKLSLANKFGKMQETTTSRTWLDRIPLGEGQYSTITRTSDNVSSETISNGMKIYLSDSSFVIVNHLDLQKQKAASEAAKLGKF